MKILRALPLIVVGLGLVGCNGFPRWDARTKKTDDVLGKLEAKDTDTKLPEIVALPPVTQPTPPPALVTPPPPMPAASKPETVAKKDAEEDIVLPRRKPARWTTKPDASKPLGGGKTYTVQRGDTLQKISMKFYGTSKSWMRIYEANKGKVKKPDMIVVGTVIRIP